MIRYLDKFGYVEPNENYLYYVIGDLASHLCRKQSIEKAKKQHPSIIVFPNEFTDFIESHDSYKDLKSRFTNSFDKSNNLTSIDNIIGLFGEIRLIKWLWIGVPCVNPRFF